MVIRAILSKLILRAAYINIITHSILFKPEYFKETIPHKSIHMARINNVFNVYLFATTSFIIKIRTQVNKISVCKIPA